MHLSKKQLIILGAIAVLFLGFLIFLGSCNKRLAVPEKPQQAEVQPAQEETPAQDDPPSIPEPVVTTRSISTAMGDISVTETTEYDENLTYSRREYLSFDKSRIQACRVEGETRQATLFSFQYQPIDATATILIPTRTHGFPSLSPPARTGRIWSQLNFPPAQVCFRIFRRLTTRRKTAFLSTCRI